MSTLANNIPYSEDVLYYLSEYKQLFKKTDFAVIYHKQIEQAVEELSHDYKDLMRLFYTFEFAAKHQVNLDSYDPHAHSFKAIIRQVYWSQHGLDFMREQAKHSYFDDFDDEIDLILLNRALNAKFNSWRQVSDHIMHKKKHFTKLDDYYQQEFLELMPFRCVVVDLLKFDDLYIDSMIRENDFYYLVDIVQDAILYSYLDDFKLTFKHFEEATDLLYEISIYESEFRSIHRKTRKLSEHLRARRQQLVSN